MNSKQREERDLNVKTLARNFPNANALKLQNDLYRLALACERNAIGLCNEPNWQDTRNELREQFKALCKKHKIKLAADVTGDPRGYCLKLHLPDGSHNTWGGKESGWGIGSI